jgi:Ca2+-binding EF-hand superfamily protein
MYLELKYAYMHLDKLESNNLDLREYKKTFKTYPIKLDNSTIEKTINLNKNHLNLTFFVF